MEKKMTKKEMFAMIMEVAGVKENEEMVNFLKHEVELLENRNSKSGKSAAKIAEMEATENLIYNALKAIGKPVTATELLANSEEVKENIITNQKLSAYLKKLIESGRVVRTMDKKKALFSIAGAPIEGEEGEEEEE